jgi:hypothetical protein
VIRRATGPLATVVVALAWLLAAFTIAAGGAGVVAVVSHQPGTAAREELTWGADQAIRPGLVRAVADLVELQDLVAGVGRAGRGALGGLVVRDSTAVARALSDGTALVEAVDAKSALLSAYLATLPGVRADGTPRVGTGLGDAYRRISEALGATEGLRRQWAILTAGAASADRLVTDLGRHDSYVVSAVRYGSAGRYDKALVRLGQASLMLDRVVALRDVLATTTDVTTLDQWIARNRALDVALRDLYAALQVADGKATPLVRQRLAEAEAARAQLPPDTRGLVVIMADIARGGLNQAVIAIEEANSRLKAALDAIRGTTGPTPGDGGDSTGGTPVLPE